MILDLYFCLWNEARLLPFFLAHYGPACRRIVALDDGSDDGTLEILGAHPKVEIRHMPEERDSWVIASTRWWNQVWQESRDADWVGIVVTDEIVGPDLPASLARHKAAGHTALKPRGFDMVSETVDPAFGHPGRVQPPVLEAVPVPPGQDECAAWMRVHREGRSDQVIHVRPDTDAAV